MTFNEFVARFNNAQSLDSSQFANTNPTHGLVAGWQHAHDEECDFLWVGKLNWNHLDFQNIHYEILHYEEKQDEWSEHIRVELHFEGNSTKVQNKYNPCVKLCSSSSCYGNYERDKEQKIIFIKPFGNDIHANVIDKNNNPVSDLQEKIFPLAHANVVQDVWNALIDMDIIFGNKI